MNYDDQEIVDRAVAYWNRMTDGQRVQMLARIGAKPTPLAGDVLKMTVKLKPQAPASQPPQRYSRPRIPKGRKRFVTRPE